MAIEPAGWLAIQNVTISGNTVTNDNGGADTCADDSYSLPNAGAYTLNALTKVQDWEFRCRLSGRNPTGRAWVGIAMPDTVTGMDPLDYTMWMHCFHISTQQLTTSAPPHPANSVYIYEESSVPVTWFDGIWNNTDQMLRIVCIGEVVRYYLDCKFLYRSLITHDYPLEAIVGFGCHNMSVVDAEIVTGPGVGVGTGAIERGMTADTDWTIPTPSVLPQPPTAGAPIATRFQEVVSDWKEYGHKFADESSRYNSALQQKVRLFELQWDGLSLEEATLLDTHYRTTAGGLPFSMVNPHTGETIINCRYGSYSVSPHTRYWSQSRSASIVVYSA